MRNKEYHSRWLLRHMLTKHPGHDESLRPQPRANAKRKEMKSEAQSQGEGSGPLGSAGDGDGDAERPRKRPRLGRHTEEEEGRDYVCGRCGSAYKQWYSLVWHTRTHHGHVATVKRKMKDCTVAVTPPRATIAPVHRLPSEARAKEVPYSAPAGEARPTETGGQAQLAED
ncbi:hypothetical protein ERJ75_001382800 [Trypanosoma vivax]|nr:hypothetical protein ERJ75_001382800 [Trypanosoma vivax]